jgi:Cupin-like domain
MQEAALQPTRKRPGLFASAETLQNWAENVDALWKPSRVQVLDETPCAIEFLRDFISPNRPCIIQGAISDPSTGQPLRVPQDADFVEWIQDKISSFQGGIDECYRIQDTEITVNVTPDGHGDTLRQVKLCKQVCGTADSGVDPDKQQHALELYTPERDAVCHRQQPATSFNYHSPNQRSSQQQVWFVKPEERRMRFGDFVNALRSSREANCTRHSRETNDESDADTIQIQSRVFPVAQTPPTVLPDCPHTPQVHNDYDSCVYHPSNNKLVQTDTSSVYYYSHQNDCLRTELAQLWQSGLFPKGFDWVSQALGSVATEPDAVNLWMGDERAVSAMHQDPYENLIYVLQGEKVVTLCPPSDAPFLYERVYPSGQFVCQHARSNANNNTEHNGNDNNNNKPTTNKDEPQPCSWSVMPEIDDEGRQVKLPWISLWDVLADKDDAQVLARYPLAQYAHPIQVRVKPGEMLYIPALWYHRVGQSCETVAINYWYDMKFDSPAWCYFSLIRELRPMMREESYDAKDNNKKDNSDA